MGLFLETESSEVSTTSTLFSGGSVEDSSMIDTTDAFSYEVPINETFSQEEYLIGLESPSSYSQKFGMAEYAVFMSVLVCSAGIGVFFSGFFGSGHKSTEEYLMGSRKMSVLPVSLSLLCR